MVLWLPTLWFLLISSKPLGTWFGAETDRGSPLDELFLSGLFFVGVLILIASRRFRLSDVLRENGWLLLLLVYSLVSVLWADIPFVAFKRWIRELIAVVMALLILVEKDPREALGSLLRRANFVLIPFSLAPHQVFPLSTECNIASKADRCGLALPCKKTALGGLVAVAVLFLVWTLARRWRGREVPVGRYQNIADLAVLALALLLLIGPGDQYSATAVASLAGAMFVYVCLSWLRERPSGWWPMSPCPGGFRPGLGNIAAVRWWIHRFHDVFRAWT